MDLATTDLPHELFRFGWHDDPGGIGPSQRCIRPAEQGGRYDDPAGYFGMLYAADEPSIAVAEVLADLRRPVPGLLAEIEQGTGEADDDVPAAPDVEAAIRAELRDRRLVTLDCSRCPGGIDLDSSDTRTALAAVVDPSLIDGQSWSELPPGLLAAASREATQRIGARIVAEARPTALIYESAQVPQHTCFALVCWPDDHDAPGISTEPQELDEHHHHVRSALQALDAISSG